MLTLEEVVESFEFWRKSRASKKEPIPERLWELARELMPYYGNVALRKALRVSESQFSKHCSGLDAEKTVAMPEEGFAVGTVERDAFHNEVCELTLNGPRKRVQMTFNICKLSQVLSVVEGYL